MIRHIAARLAHDDEDSDDTYPTYVKRLCVLAGQDEMYPMLANLAAACKDIPDSYPSSKICGDSFCGGSYCEFDLVAGAAYLNKLSVIDKVANSDHHLRIHHGIFGDPYICAALGDNAEAVQLLFHKAELHNQRYTPFWVRHSRLTLVARLCSTTMTQLFVPEWPPAHYEDFEGGKRGYATETLDHALLTPHVDTFDFVMGLKKKTQYPDLEKAQLLSLLDSACEYGWVEMAQHLLALGAPLEVVGAPLKDDDFVYWKCEDPLRVTCEGHRGGTMHSEAIVRLLLSHGARIKGDEVALAAETGNIGVVQALVEAGADVNKGEPHPLVSAIALERVDLFKALLSWGAELNSEVKGACVERAKQENLESMLELLM
jgi:hypothetical protein